MAAIWPFLNFSDDIFSQTICLNEYKLGATLGPEVSEISKSFIYDIQDGRNGSYHKILQMKYFLPPCNPLPFIQPLNIRLQQA